MHQHARASLGLLDTCLVHDGRLLLNRHGERVLVRVAVKTNLVPGIPDHFAFCRKGLERVARYEPRRLDLVLFEALQQSTHADCASKVACARGVSVPTGAIILGDVQPLEMSEVEFSPP